jgi:hypothetical protein
LVDSFCVDVIRGRGFMAPDENINIVAYGVIRAVVILCDGTPSNSIFLNPQFYLQSVQNTISKWRGSWGEESSVALFCIQKVQCLECL